MTDREMQERLLGNVDAQLQVLTEMSNLRIWTQATTEALLSLAIDIRAAQSGDDPEKIAALAQKVRESEQDRTIENITSQLQKLREQAKRDLESMGS